MDQPIQEFDTAMNTTNYSGGLENIEGDNMEVVKAFVLGSLDSQQLPPSNPEATIDIAASGKALVPPPVDLDLLAACPDINSRLSRCIRTYARNTGGLGGSVQPKDPIGENTTEAEKTKIEDQTKQLNAVFLRPNQSPNKMTSMSKILELVRVDEETIGNGYMEVTRNLAGEIAGLYHVPGRTVRLLEDGTGFAQTRCDRTKYFKHFRDTEMMNAETGERGKVVAKDKRATELIHFKIESVRSYWYGVPRWYPAVPAVAGNRYASMRNVSFFENDAVPRLLITITGGKLLDKSVQAMRQFFELRGKGPSNAHRVCIMQAEPRHPGGTPGSSNVAINVEKLTLGVEDEASFRKYQEANNEEIREVFGIAKIFFAPSSSNRANASIERQITNEQEFEPARLELEYTINNLLCLDILAGGIHEPLPPPEDVLVKFKLRRPSAIHVDEQADIHQKYAQMGALTPNEIRQELGKPAFTDEEPFANKPVSYALTELQVSPAMARAGLIPLIGEFKEDASVSKKEDKEKEDNEKNDEQEEEEAEKGLTGEDRELLEELRAFMEAQVGEQVNLFFKSRPKKTHDEGIETENN